MDSSKPVAVLFDFDGVVMDTETQYSKFWGKQGEKYCPEVSDFSRVIKGSTLTQILNKYFVGKGELQQKIVLELEQFERNMLYEYIPGFERFLQDLKANDVKTAIVTSSNELKMENVYRAHPELKNNIDRIITAEFFQKSKPDPECFLLGAELLNTVPGNCFVFEDSFNGLEAANRSGMTVIGLSGTNGRDAISDKASMVIDDFLHLSYAEIMKLKD